MFRSKGRIQNEKRIKIEKEKYSKSKTKNRIRNKTVAFRLSETEAILLDDLVKSSGLMKQEYILQALINHKVTYIGSPKMAKGIAEKLDSLMTKVMDLKSLANFTEELIYIEKIATLYLDIKRDKDSGNKEGTTKEDE